MVQKPENRMARLGSSPITRGKTKVAPNMATTCWAPRPIVLPHGRRCIGSTACPGAGSTTSHLNIDMRRPPDSTGWLPEKPQTSAVHLTPSLATSAEGTPQSLTSSRAGRASPGTSPLSVMSVDGPAADGDARPSVAAASSRVPGRTIPQGDEMKRILATTVLALATVGATGTAASAGEITGNGNPTPINGYNANSICAFSGLDDMDFEAPVQPGVVQNW